MSTDQKENFERRMQSIAQAVMTALLLWVGYAIVGVRDTAIKLEVQVAQLNKEAVDVKAELVALRGQILTAAIAAANAAQSAASAAERNGKR